MTAAAAIPISSKPLKHKERRAAGAYRRYLKLQEKASALYEAADRMAFKLAKKIGEGKAIRISSDGRGIEVVDLYQAAIHHPKRKPEQMPKAWAHAAVRQFEIREVNLVS